MKQLTAAELQLVKTLNNIDDIEKYAESNLTLISCSTRCVWIASPGCVLKTSHGKRGQYQNSVEIMVSLTSEGDHLPIARVIAYGNNERWLLMERAKMLESEHAFSKLTNVSLNDIKKCSNGNHAACKKNEFSKNVHELITRYHLDGYDASIVDHWGVVNNNVVLVDYGDDVG